MRTAVIACCFAFLSSPLVAQEANEVRKEEKAETQDATTKKDDEICKFIRTDMNSRRKQKVCMTSEEWVRFNRGN
ncbi:hypothetical protein [Qipengyuania sp. RANM35]|uniref:hypothetical protein n=1 Tax=Qipengyuania sp. RANM35 TaxID=3068635 RepID=UPI0034DB2852